MRDPFEDLLFIVGIGYITYWSAMLLWVMRPVWHKAFIWQQAKVEASNLDGEYERLIDES